MNGNMLPACSSKALGHMRVAARATLLVSALSAVTPPRALCAQTPRAGPDNVRLYREAQRLSTRADTLALGSVSDQWAAVNLLRRAADLHEQGGGLREHGAVLKRIGAVFNNFGQQDSALAYYRKALPQARATNARDIEADILAGTGDVFKQLGNTDSALASYRQGLPLARAVNARTIEADILGGIGDVFTTLGAPDSALRHYSAALPIKRSVRDRKGEARMLNKLGGLYIRLGQPDSALSYLGAGLVISRSISDPLGQAGFLTNIGVIFGQIGKPDSAIRNYREALPLSRAVGRRSVEARILGNLGLIFLDRAELDSALTYTRQAQEIFGEIDDRDGEATAVSTLASLFSEIGQPDSTLSYLRQTLSIRRDIGDRPGEAHVLSNIGAHFGGLGQPDSALFQYRLAMPLLRATDDRDALALTLVNLGIALGETGQPDSSMAQFRQALSIFESTQNLEYRADALEAIGWQFGRVGAVDSALAYYREAVSVFEALGERTSEASALASVAEIYRGIGRLDSAVVYFDRSTSLSAAVSKRTGTDFNRLSYNESTRNTYAPWILAWLGLAAYRSGEAGTGAVNSTSAAYGALAASESGRAQALLDLMRDSATSVKAGANFPADGVKLAATLQRASSAGLVYAITADTLVTWLISSTGEVNVFRRAISRDSLVARVGTFRDAFGVEGGGGRLVLRGGTLEAGAARGSGKGAAGTWRRQADELRIILLPAEVLRLLDSEKEVVILPHGVLALVPFAGLPVGPAGEPFGSGLAIRYAPSLGTLGQAETRVPPAAVETRARTFRQALVVGNPTMPEVRISDGTRGRLASLPGAEAESRSIASQLGTTALTGSAATESAVMRKLANAPLVHLATHGFAYSTEARARNSFVALAPDSSSDGLLTVAKILDDSNLKLTADLVVLSACQTALGDLKQAEGTVGLQRAFLAKGARSVLVSLWNVSDAATQKLMTGFYQHWLRDPDHPSKAEALRRSQEEVRKIPGFEHPRFWAAFQLAGAK